jgi:hypothetical protein
MRGLSHGRGESRYALFMLAALSAAILISMAPGDAGELHWPVLQAKAYAGIPSFGVRAELAPIEGFNLEGSVGGTLLGPNVWTAGARYYPTYFCIGCENVRGVSWRLGIGAEYWGFWGDQAVDEGVAVVGPDGVMHWRFSDRQGLAVGLRLGGGSTFTLDGSIVDPIFTLHLDVGLVLF